MTDAIFDRSSLFARSFYAMTSDGMVAKPDEIVKSALTTIFSLLDPNSQKLGEYIDRI